MCAGPLTIITAASDVTFHANTEPHLLEDGAMSKAILKYYSEAPPIRCPFSPICTCSMPFSTAHPPHLRSILRSGCPTAMRGSPSAASVGRGCVRPVPSGPHWTRNVHRGAGVEGSFFQICLTFLPPLFRPYTSYTTISTLTRPSPAHSPSRASLTPRPWPASPWARH